MDKQRKLTHKEEAFVQEVMRTGNQAEAYRRAYKPSPKASVNRIAEMACGVAKRPNVLARIAELKSKIANDVLMDATAVVRHLAEIAIADPNELTQYRRVNCRYCHGVGHKYQWKHRGEFAHAWDEWQEAKDAAESRKPPKPYKKPPPVEDGGYGFKANADPHPDCPECLGEGIEEVHITDTRKLTGPARRLFAGVRQTKNGVEILTRSQDSAIKMLGEHFGIFKQVIDLNALQKIAQVTLTTNDPVEAAKAYEKIMNGEG
jgi:phage terminase small subunit